MAKIEDAAGQRGLFTDGDWILSDNMVGKGTIGVIQLKHVGVGEFHHKEFQFISDSTFKELGCTEVRPGDVLISRMADPIGRACIVPHLPFRSVTAVDVSILRVDESVADSRFITHLCNSQLMRDRIAKVARGATRSRITRTELGETEIPLPSLAEQHRIAAQLEQADRLVRTRRYALELSATLLPAVFHKFFGKANSQSGDWPSVELAELCDHEDDVRCGPFGTQLNKSEFRTSGIPLWGIKHVNAEFALRAREFLTETKAEELDEYSLLPGDLVMTRKGTVGNCALYPAHFPRGVMHSDLLRIRLKSGVCSPLFLMHQLHNSRAIERQIEMISGGAIMAGINVGMLKSIKIQLPPLPLQQRFANMVTRVERLRAAQRESLRLAEHLFQSLLHDAFGTETTHAQSKAHYV
jgi:type I restriction enzyme S subunit